LAEQADRAGRAEISAVKRRLRADKKRLLALGLIVNFGMLAVLKYSAFVVENIDALLHLRLTLPSLILPLGISFYTFQTAGYMIDVFRKKHAADRNIFKFALFTSFFPQVVQGPISRYSQLASQLYAPNRFSVDNFRRGMLLILWGYFKKLVIADRAIVLVNHVLDRGGDYGGFHVVVFGVVYMFQIYADFSGGIDISRGVARVLGIDLAVNFRAPYLSKSVSEYWQRWHITLGTWMRDYIFFPLSLSPSFGRLGRLAKNGLGVYFGRVVPPCIAMGIVFLVVGIWHGAAWQYIALGVYNAFFIMIGVLFAPALTAFNERRGIVRTDAFWWKGLLIAVNFVVIFFSKFFMVSHGAAQAVGLIRSIFVPFDMSVFSNGSLFAMGLGKVDCFVLVCAVLVLVVSDVMEERRVVPSEWIMGRGVWIRWPIYLVGIFAILIFGMYGPDVDPAQFVYQEF
jgi:D-alanyl-lipoteichoic acid acyltransferase DltB (MBOAT superfamily)